MEVEDEDLGSFLIDMSHGHLLQDLSEEWVTEVELQPENQPENDGRDGRDGRVGLSDGFLANSWENLVGTEPPEWTVPIVNIMGAYGSPPPSRQGPPPSRHGHPPAQPEQPTTARFPAPVRRVAIQHCRRLSVYPFLPEWPGQAAANSDRLYGRASSRDMVSRG